MFFKKKSEKIKYVKLSDTAVDFIKNVVVPELNITTAIGTNEICKIEDWIYELEYMQYDEQGNDVNLDKSVKEKITRAQDLLSELMSIWGATNSTEDFDDLNKRLGLI